MAELEELAIDLTQELGVVQAEQIQVVAVVVHTQIILVQVVLVLLSLLSHLPLL